MEQIFSQLKKIYPNDYKYYNTDKVKFFLSKLKIEIKSIRVIEEYACGEGEDDDDELIGVYAEITTKDNKEYSIEIPYENEDDFINIFNNSDSE